jgi:16S rRNA A1518/A1519 N6-dimethyltransferase RsmA/KsgA/DIM1 with predicted DNA glycosylase/AP lyase activity
MMLKLLREDWPAEKLERAFDELRLSPQTRAEEVSLEQFVGLVKALK